MIDHLWLLIHVVVLGYWLGTDLAVYYVSGAISDSRRPPAVRVYAARTMLLLDMVPRSALILTLLSGGMLAAQRWLGLSGSVVLWLWPVLMLAWLALTWQVYRRGSEARIATRIDWAVRGLVVAACLALAVVLGRGLWSYPVLSWLAVKLVLMAWIILLGLVIRVQLKPFAALFAKVAAGQADEATDRALARLIAEIKFPVWLIWVSLVLAAVMGIVRPALWS